MADKMAGGDDGTVARAAAQKELAQALEALRTALGEALLPAAAQMRAAIEDMYARSGLASGAADAAPEPAKAHGGDWSADAEGMRALAARLATTDAGGWRARQRMAGGREAAGKGAQADGGALRAGWGDDLEVHALQAEGVPARPPMLTIDGQALARALAAENRAAMGEYNRRLAMGVGQ